MTKQLKPPKILKDGKYWVILDDETNVYTQAKTKRELKDNYIDALRCMVASYKKHAGDTK